MKNKLKPIEEILNKFDEYSEGWKHSDPITGSMYIEYRAVWHFLKEELSDIISHERAEAVKETKRKAEIVREQPYGTPRIDWHDNPFEEYLSNKGN